MIPYLSAPTCFIQLSAFALLVCCVFKARYFWRSYAALLLDGSGSLGMLEFVSIFKLLTSHLWDGHLTVQVVDQVLQWGECSEIYRIVFWGGHLVAFQMWASLLISPLGSVLRAPARFLSWLSLSCISVCCVYWLPRSYRFSELHFKGS